MTFPDLLDDNRRAWGTKIVFQQKIRRDWHRISHAEVYRRSYELAAGLVALGLEQGERVALIGKIASTGPAPTTRSSSPAGPPSRSTTTSSRLKSAR